MVYAGPNLKYMQLDLQVCLGFSLLNLFNLLQFNVFQHSNSFEAFILLNLKELISHAYLE